MLGHSDCPVRLHAPKKRVRRPKIPSLWGAANPQHKTAYIARVRFSYPGAWETECRTRLLAISWRWKSVSGTSSHSDIPLGCSIHPRSAATDTLGHWRGFKQHVWTGFREEGRSTATLPTMRLFFIPEPWSVHSLCQEVVDCGIFRSGPAAKITLKAKNAGGGTMNHARTGS